MFKGKVDRKAHQFGEGGVKGCESTVLLQNKACYANSRWRLNELTDRAVTIDSVDTWAGAEL